MESLIKHWNELYKRTDDDKLGWHENDFSQTLKFLDLIPGRRNSKIFIPGVGISGLIEVLLKDNVSLILNDVSSEAIEKAKNKHDDKAHHIQWLCQDIARPLPLEINDVDIWIDRAVLHFLTDDSSVEQYFKNVNAAVKIGGYALCAEFSKKGAPKCAGLDVRRYDIQDLERNLPLFELIAHEEYTFVNPYGDPRPFIYTLFKKVKNG